MGPGATSTAVLLITAEPDDRESTRQLALLRDELEARDDVDVTVWFLRDRPEARAWPGTWCVDELRRSWLNQLVVQLGLGTLAARVSGLRLRLRWARVRPHVVVLDDGIGGRVLGPGDHRLVGRFNREQPESLAKEVPTDPSQFDLLIGQPDGRPDGRTEVVPNGQRRPSAEMRAPLTADQRAQARARAGLPDVAGPLVVGWGDDVLIDGADLFVRTLWHLEHRQGMAATGLWLRTTENPIESHRLRQEAERCGVADRFLERVSEDERLRSSGDAVFLTSLLTADEATVADLIISGSRVVEFGDDRAPTGDLVRSVPPLDLDAAAEALHAVLRGSPEDWFQEVRRELDAGWLAERLVGLAERP